MKRVRISDVRPGDHVQCYGFDCIEAGGVREVKHNPNAAADAKRYGCFSDHHALFVDCDRGGHLLEAQIDFANDGDTLIGVHPDGEAGKTESSSPNFREQVHAQVRNVAAHVFHPENDVSRNRLVKLPGGGFALGPKAKKPH